MTGINNEKETLASDWIFSDPPNSLVFLSQKVDSGDEAITYVSHDVIDGAWQFLGNSMANFLMS